MLTNTQLLEFVQTRDQRGCNGGKPTFLTKLGNLLDVGRLIKVDGVGLVQSMRSMVYAQIQAETHQYKHFTHVVKEHTSLLGDSSEAQYLILDVQALDTSLSKFNRLQETEELTAIT